MRRQATRNQSGGLVTALSEALRASYHRERGASNV